MQVRHQYWLQQAIDYFGGSSKLAKALGVPRQRIHDWMYVKEFPYYYAVKIEQLTYGKIEASLLCPKLASVAQYYRSTANKRVHRPTHSIRTQFIWHRPSSDIDRLKASIQRQGLKHPVGVSNDGQLLFGHQRFNLCLALGYTQIPVKMVSIHGLLTSNESADCYRLVDRLSIIYSIIRQITAFRQSPTLYKAQLAEINSLYISQNPDWEKAGKLVDDKVAKALGLNSKNHYYRLKRLVEDNQTHLVHAIDSNSITLTMAEYLAPLPHEKQQHLLQCEPSERHQFFHRMKRGLKHESP